MIDLEGYHVKELMFKSKNSLVFSGVRNKDNLDIVIKIPNNNIPSQEDLSRMRFEYIITSKFTGQGVVKACGIEKYKHHYALILEKVEGKKLQEVIGQYEFSVPDKIQIAIDIAQSLLVIHQQKVIHKDINSSNILLNPQTKEVTIIDFGLSTELLSENAIVQNPEKLRGTLEYISPEQTGRVTHYVDYRTDFYSLGVTLYELFTNKLPFQSSDMLELIHAHIAKMPEPPHEVSEILPESLSLVIMKLLKKNPEDRYQTIDGLIYDLKNIRQAMLEEAPDMNHFVLGEKDFSRKFQIPNQIYGRAKEINTIVEAYEDTSQGNTVLCEVKGYSGIGKSSLIKEIHKPLLKNQGYFVLGKFDQFQRDIPYYGFKQAFEELIKQILTKPEEEISFWKKSLLEALGVNGKVITSLIPELELVIGTPPPLVPMGIEESKNRFNALMLGFIRVFARVGHPLVIVLDDMQWADVASLQLIEYIFDQQEGMSLLCVITYRSNEVDKSHQLTATLDKVKATNVGFESVELETLGTEAVTELVNDTLHTDSTLSAPLVKLVQDKTGGNPFSINEFLKYLYEEKLVAFNTTTFLWDWDIDKISLLNIQDNVADILLKKINSLSDLARDVLMYAACIGHRFRLTTLAIVQNKDIREVQQQLKEVIREGFIAPIGNAYKMLYLNSEQIKKADTGIEFKFVHDKIQKTAYTSLEEAQKKRIHLDIAYSILKGFTEEEVDKYFFDILSHLNYGRDLIAEPAEKQRVVQMNLKATQKAKESIAYSSALSFIMAAKASLPENLWADDYGTTLNVYELLAEIYYLNGDYLQAQQTIDEALTHTQSILDEASLHETSIQVFLAQGQFIPGINYAIDVLKLLGVDLPKNPSPDDMIAELGATKEALANQDILALVDLPFLKDEEKNLAIQLINHIFAITYIASPLLFIIITLKLVRICLEYGNPLSSPLLYAVYGLLCSVFGDLPSVEKFGQVSLALLEKFQAEPIRSKVYQFLCVGGVTHYDSYEKAIAMAENAIRVGLASGDITYTGLSSLHLSALMFYNGKLLNAAEQRMSRLLHWLAKKQHLQYHSTIFYQQAALRLAGQTPDVDFQPEVSLEVLQNANSISDIANAHLVNGITHFIMKEYAQAQGAFGAANTMQESLNGTFYYNELKFFNALLLLKHDQGLSHEEVVQKVEEDQKLMKMWADFAPMNFSCKYWLVEAEKARFTNNAQAIDFYDQAIDEASKYTNYKMEALANELAGEFLLSTNKKRFARVYLQDSHRLYNLWGASAKAQLLEKKYPEINMSHSRGSSGLSQTIHSSTLATNSSSLESIDLISIAKASQALSGEIVLRDLLKRMMHIVIENAGAERGVLVMQEGNQLLIQAESNSRGAEVEVLNSIPLENAEGNANAPGISSSIVQYVVRTKESVVLADAVNEGQFTNLDYVKKLQPKSILCTPLINQGKLSGILYLENPLIKGAFTSERTETLSILSSQIAISIENALLYENLEEKVRERTSKLSEAYDEIKQKNKDITAGISYASRIQTAMLPRMDEISRIFPDSFVLFKPLDIVSGDFYWIAEVEDKVLFAAVDCTGHGVPGAFMSSIGNEILNQIVKVQKITQPKDILQQLHEGIKTALRQKETKNHDGMDMALSSWDKTKNEITFAGAKNSLVYVCENKLDEIKGNRLLIGGFKKKNTKKFEQVVLKINSSTAFYMFSDGYADQFGGESGTRLMKKEFKQVLLDIHKKPMQEQQRLLEQNLADWMGEYKQIDDILVVGFRID